MSSTMNTAKLKAIVIEMWRRGGMDTLIKAVPKGLAPDPSRTSGYCTTFKFTVGRTPSEIEQIVGLAIGSKLVSGADIYTFDPLPSPAEFRASRLLAVSSRASYGRSELCAASRLSARPRRSAVGTCWILSGGNEEARHCRTGRKVHVHGFQAAFAPIGDCRSSRKAGPTYQNWRLCGIRQTVTVALPYLGVMRLCASMCAFDYLRRD
jgi:hypothetical protein